VLEVIQKSSDFLAKKGVDSPRLQVELLLAHQLRLPRMKLYLNFDRVLAPAELNALRELVRRRGLREPLQHITGSTSFCGFEMAVSRQVLIPRPETELLAELGWEFLNQLTARKAAPVTALDFGTGSGCLAIALAAKAPAAAITALDVSPEALAMARQNAAANAVADRMTFVQGDGFAALTHSPEGRVTRVPNQIGDSHSSSLPSCFDLIVSNPPYIASAEIPTLQPEVRDYDPRLALDGGADGLDCYRRLAAEAAAHLKPGGKLMLEFGDGQAGDLQNLFAAQNWVVEGVKEDYSHRARILILRR
jgi:release factor glutamine methyltransferase